MQTIHIFLMLMLILLIVLVWIAEINRKERERKARQRLKRYQVRYYYKGGVDDYIEPELKIHYYVFMRAHTVDELKHKFKAHNSKRAIIDKITRLDNFE
ncbi:MAG: hypothetical protein Q4A46_07635 [Clostridia bacterium]|nr:hypothetical protein [Clostridia bacterium]